MDRPAGVPTGTTAPGELRAPLDPRRDAFVRGLVRGLRCGLIVVDPHGRLVLLNGLARQILEIDGPVEPGALLGEVVAGHERVSRLLHDAFTLTNLPNRAEMEIRTGSGGTKTLGFTVSLVKADDGTTEGAAMFFKDLTHVEHREEQERLRDRLAALGQMAANLAHEIRNPLASIEVSCSLLKRRPPSSDAGKELLDKIIAEVRRLNRTISSSLEFVRPLSLSPASSKIDAVLDDALATSERRWGRPGVRVVRRYDEGVPAFLMDRGQIRQVFENLFLNAMEAMGDEGSLTVETELVRTPTSGTTPYEPDPASPGDPWRSFRHFVEVRVQDTGPGIAPEHHDKLFYPFFTTKKHGSGVGLSLAKKIVDSHRGVIDVDCRSGGGALFTVRLPAVTAEAEDPKS